MPTFTPSVALAFACLACLVAGCAPDGAREGQRGLDAYLAGDLETAASAFSEGLQATDTPEADPDVRARLLYDLGLVRHEDGDTEAALDLFEQAAQIAPTRRAQARARYNAGTAAALAQDFEAALDHLRRALLLDPRYAEAKVNYELVKRQLEGDQPEPPEEPPPPEPSAFAEAVKARADSLIAALRYADALQAMQAGLAVDSTVEAYADFIGRLQGVVRIEQGESEDGPPGP
ncbi:MAG: tetratricopeptide repeat protein [Bacteroidota bacterium]